MKREARLVLFHACGGAAVAAVLRGPWRVEAFLHATGFEELVSRVRSSRFFDELRGAWPPEAAEALGLRPVEPSRVLGGCLGDVESLLRDYCEAARSIIGAWPGAAPPSGSTRGSK